MLWTVKALKVNKPKNRRIKPSKYSVYGKQKKKIVILDGFNKREYRFKKKKKRGRIFFPRKPLMKLGVVCASLLFFLVLSFILAFPPPSLLSVHFLIYG